MGTLTTKFDFFRQSKLDSPTGVNFGQFGGAVATSGDGNTLIVGAPGQGTATVFVRSGDTWIVQQQLTNPNGNGGGNFGFSVALSADGNTALVGAFNEAIGFNDRQGTATVFVRSGDVWTVQQKITLASGGRNYQFGFRVALSGDGRTAVVSARGTDGGRGSLIVFTSAGGIWTEGPPLIPADAVVGDEFGVSVAISSDGNTIIAGAYLDDVGTKINQGSAYVFVRSAGAWTQQQQISHGVAGDFFGWSVALSGDGNTALIGAEQGQGDLGYVVVFKRSAGAWTQQQVLTAANRAPGDRFSAAVALSVDGNTAVITSYRQAATVFTRSSGIWTRQPQIPSPGYTAALSGDGDLLVVGNPNERVGNDFSNNEIGRAYVLTHPRSRAGNGSITVSAADTQIGGPMFSGGTVSLAPSQPNRPIDLGDKTAGELGLTDAELDLITAGTLQIGDGNSGPIAITADITRAAKTDVDLTSGGVIHFRGGLVDTGGGNLRVSPASNAAVLVGKSGSDASLGASGTLSFASGSGLSIAIDGLAVDAEHDQLNLVGQVDLTGANLVLSGAYNPAIGDTFVVVSNDGSDAVVGTFNGLPEGKVLIVPHSTSEAFGGAFAITYQGGDGNDVVLTAVNTAPTFVVGADQNVTSESGPLTIAPWATSISPGLPGEAGQQLQFIITANTNPDLFAALPAIDATGNLAFTPAVGKVGSATITVILQDSGGVTGGGIDASPPQTFKITIEPPFQPPITSDDAFDALEDSTIDLAVTANDNSGGPVGDWFIAIVAGPTHGSLLPLPNGQVRYTPTGNYFGPDQFTYQLTNGASVSNIAAVSLSVWPINDPPSFVIGPDISAPAGSPPQSFENWATQISAGAGESGQTSAFQLSADNPGLFTVQPAVDASGRLTFAPAAGGSGVAIISIYAQDDGGREDGGIDRSPVQTFRITIEPRLPGVRLEGSTLIIIGSAEADALTLSRSRNVLVVSGTLGESGVNRRFAAARVTLISAELGSGNDWLSIARQITTPVIISGGAGNDTIIAVGGPSVLVGGDGNDFLIGGTRRDLLIGGAGRDQLAGGGGSDLLIAGYTSYDESPSALLAIEREWNSARTLAQRRSNLRTGSGPILGSLGVKLVHGETVFDDQAIDTLLGGGDLDWFFADARKDRIRDRLRSEVVG